MEKIVETKVCKHCDSSFEITDKDMEFYEKVSPIFAGKKYNIPTPKLCPDCRQQRRLSFRNERKLYKRKCDATGKDIISMYSPDKKYKVYHQDYWWSDKWDAMDYGRDFDFNRGFFEQFNEFVLEDVPQLALLNTETENSEYSNFIKGAKNSYLSSVVYYEVEDIYYSNWIMSSKNVWDCYNVHDSELLYQCIYSQKCYKSFYLINSEDCTNCYYSKKIIGCRDCILCTNLVGKKYCIENKQYTQEEYFLEKGKYDLFGPEIYNKFLNIIKNIIVPAVNFFNCENCIGDNLNNSKNAFYCFDTYEIEDSKYVVSERTKSCYDGIGGTIENSYEYCRVGRGSKNIFCYDEIESNFTSYCWSTYYSENCFGCVGVRNKSYCIFNKQYTKQEYEILVPKIINHMMKTGEWGEFFPGLLSPFGYNESTAIEQFSLSKEEAIKKGFKWSDYETPFPKVEKIIPANKLPNNIKDIPDDILNWAIECGVTNKPFRIIKQELEFYRKYNIPIPKRSPDQRYLDRINLINPRKLFDRKCNKCGIDIKTTYAPEREEIVYCEECYNKEVY